MRNQKRYLILSAVLNLIFIAFSCEVYAIPAAPIVHTLTQPDGTTFQARQWGDEWFHRWETEEGYTIVFDEDLKSWTYAELNNSGKLASSLKRVGIDKVTDGISKHLLPEKNSYFLIPQKTLTHEMSPEYPQNAIPLQGTANIPVILVNFINRTPAYSTTAFNSLLFGTSNYSMKDYYSEVSYGKFTVAPGPGGVVGWYTASNTHDYYGANDADGQDRWPGTLVREAVAAADAAGFNFAPYDQDGDGYADIVAIVHQGTGEEEGSSFTDIWSHRWSLNAAYYWGYSNGGEYTTNDSKPGVGSIKVNNYVIQPEIFYGNMQTVGVFAHEYGHALGLPDLYDRDYSSAGVGNWSLMAGGSWTYVSRPGDRPAHLDPWSKYKLGWITPTIVSGTLINESINQVESNEDIYQLLSGSPSSGGEYFLVENRQKVGFDAGLPGSGLLIWHIDENMSSNDNECYPGGPSCTANHYKVAVMQADNLWELEKSINRGNPGDPYPGSINKTSFTDSNLWNGGANNISITEISTSGPVMTAILSNAGNAITTTTISGNCPDDYPIDCYNGWCCPLVYPYCGTGTNSGMCFTEPQTSTTTSIQPTTSSSSSSSTTSRLTTSSSSSSSSSSNSSSTTSSLPCVDNGDCPAGQGCDNGVCKTKYTLTVQINGEGTGKVLASFEGGGQPLEFMSMGTAQYFTGTEVSLSAIPQLINANLSYKLFGGWNGDLTGLQTPATVTMNSDKNITANFFEVNVNDGQGYVSMVSVVDPLSLPGNVIQNKPKVVPYGFISVGITQITETAMFTVTLPAAAPPGAKWYKCSDQTNGCIDFSRSVISGGTGDGAVLSPDRKSVTVFITDNSIYDDDPATGSITDPSGLGVGCITNSDCNDGLFCNGTETCNQGTCVAGTSPCTAGKTCNETNDTCVSTATTSTSGGGGGGGGGGTSTTTTSITIVTTTIAQQTTTTTVQASTTSTSIAVTTSVPQTTTTTVNKICPGIMVSANNPDRMNQLHQFRDRILLQTAEGREYVRLFYNNQMEIAVILLRNAEALKKAKEIIESLMPEIALTVQNNTMTISRGMMNRINGLLTMINTEASPELKAVIGSLQVDLIRGEAFKKIGIEAKFN